MIYDKEIQIPILCPIEFQEPNDLDFYPNQEKYVPKITNLNNKFWLQFRISEGIYNDTSLWLRIIDKNSLSYTSFYHKIIDKFQLSSSYYFGIVEVDLSDLTENSFIQFQIVEPLGFGERTIFADSVIYEYLPNYDKDIKVIRYSHNKNDYGVVFKRPNNGSFILYDFSIVLECGIIPNGFSQEANKEDFEDQFMNNNVIYSMPYEKFVLTLGDGLGIPNWLIRKINYLMQLDNIAIQDKPYTLSKGAKIEKIEDTYIGLATYKIDIQQENDFMQSMDKSFKIHNSVFNYIYS